MKDRLVYFVITVMSISMIGILVLQALWFRTSVARDEKNFSDKVQLVLSIVRDKLAADAVRYEQSVNIIGKDIVGEKVLPKGSDASNNDWKKQQVSEDMGLFNKSDIEIFLNNIGKDNLDRYIKQEMEQQGIDIAYDYGIYNNITKTFSIVNGNYMVSLADVDVQASKGSVSNGLHNSDYKIPLYTSLGREGVEDASMSPGLLKIFFPSKNNWLWSSVIPSVLMSLLFTILVLSSFAYTMYIVFRQKRISEMKTDFINNMTHEFKTPIATISLATDSIDSPFIISNEEKVRRFTGIIKQENARMLNQVEKVLQMALIDKQDFELKEQEININDLVVEACMKIELRVEQRKGKIAYQLDATDANMIGDQTHISNIIYNLLDNAEKYSPDGRVDIFVRTFNQGDNIGIAISDKGVGVTTEQKKLIFERFYRVHTGNIHNVKGFGLGLSYVKAIVDGHEGEIEIDSEYGVGSTFTVLLPLKPNK